MAPKGQFVMLNFELFVRLEFQYWLFDRAKVTTSVDCEDHLNWKSSFPTFLVLPKCVQNRVFLQDHYGGCQKLTHIITASPFQYYSTTTTTSLTKKILWCPHVLYTIRWERSLELIDGARLLVIHQLKKVWNCWKFMRQPNWASYAYFWPRHMLWQGYRNDFVVVLSNVESTLSTAEIATKPADDALFWKFGKVKPRKTCK